MRHEHIIVGHDGRVTNVYHNNTLSCDPPQVIPMGIINKSPNTPYEGTKVILLGLYLNLYASNEFL